MSRPALALAMLLTAGVVPLAAVGTGWDWYLDGPLMVLLPAVAGYAAGAWLPRRWAAAAVAATVALLVLANQAYDDAYHWLDDLVFYLVVVGGPAVAGAAVTVRAQQLRRLTALQAELEEVQRLEVATARLDEQSRVAGEVHTDLAERIAGIALRAEGARRAADATALDAIEAEARSVLDRLRGTLGSMRAAQPAPEAEPTASEEPRRAVDLTWLDVVLPLVLGAAIAVETALISSARGPAWANAAAALAVVAPLVLRRRHPIAAVAATCAAAIAMTAVLTPIPETVTGVALLVVVFYAVGAWCPGRWWLLGWLVAAAGTLAMEWVATSGDEAADGGDAGWIVLLWTVGAVALGRVTAGWQDRVRRTEAVVAALERGRGAAVRLAVAREREVLASELHDTVAHAMTVVCLQAGGHRRTGGSHDEALGLIASVAERSLVELREGLDAMDSAEHPLDRSRLTALGRRVGVDLRVDADDAGSGPAAALAHRVIREAVVNVARHAPGASAAVSVHRSGDGLSVEVLDDGGAGQGVVDGTGTGLRGLAETLESVGGRLEWGHREPRGFRVAACIPQEQR